MEGGSSLTFLLHAVVKLLGRRKGRMDRWTDRQGGVEKE